MDSVRKEQIGMDILQQFGVQLPVFGDQRRQGGLRRLVEEGIALGLQPDEGRLHVGGIHHHIRRHIQIRADRQSDSARPKRQRGLPTFESNAKRRQNCTFFRVRVRC